MKISTWLISLIACLAAFTGNAAAQCTRHFYNNSAVPFTVAMVEGLCNNSLVCTINPGQTGTLTYLGLVTGGITVSSAFYNDGFGVSACHIIHSGATGYVAVNDPSDGDVTTCGSGGWYCPPVYACPRRFYNDSPVPAQISVTSGSCNGAAQCTISPGQIGYMLYGVPNSGQSASLNISSSLFSTSLSSNAALCTFPVLRNPPGLAFNRPGNGDITTCGGANFPCPPPRHSRKHAKTISH